MTTTFRCSLYRNWIKSLSLALAALLIFNPDPSRGQNSKEEDHNHSVHSHHAHQHGHQHNHSVDLAHFTSIGQAWELAQEATHEMESAISSKKFAPVHESEEELSSALRYMQKNSSMVTGDKAKRLEAALKQALTLASNIHNAADSNDQAKAQTDLKKLQGSLKLVQAQYPADLLVTAQHNKNEDHSCPIHTSSSEPTISMSALTSKPLKATEKADVTITLKKKDGSALLLSDLEETHTQKIHLLIIDSSLSDYHHQHPTATAKPGEYTFSFTPRKPGSYRVWADLLPTATHAQEYAMADIAAPTKGQPISQKNPQMRAQIGELKYDLSFQKPSLTEGQEVLGKLKITDSKGNIYTQLEPVMGAYAHLVGFSEDYKSIAHVHPMGPEPKQPSDRGAGELEFHLTPPKAGLMRLFAQVHINGKDQFVSFTLPIAPAKKQN